MGNFIVVLFVLPVEKLTNFSLQISFVIKLTKNAENLVEFCITFGLNLLNIFKA